MRSSARSVPSMAARSCCSQVALGVVVLGEDEDAACRSTSAAARRRRCPSGGRPGHMFSRIQSIELRTRASGRPRAASAISVISSSSACSAAPERSAVASAAAGSWPRWPPRPAPPPRPASSSSASSARSSSASTPPASRSSCRRRAVGAGPCLAWPASHCRSHRPAMDRERAGERLDRGEQPLLQPGDEQAGRGLLALGLAREALARELCGTRRAARERRSSGASAGRPSMSTCTTLRFGKPPAISRMSSLSRRTITSSSSFLPCTGTPRQKRCGSRISSRAEKLFEWPLCGVAERNRRCSKRGARSRMARVILRVDGVAAAARRGGVVGLVEDQQRCRARSRPSQSRSGSA